VIKFTPLPISPGETGEEPPNPVNRRLGELQSWSGYSEEEKSLVPLQSIEGRNIQPVTQ